MDIKLERAFIDQARKHLEHDFMPKIRRCLDLLSEEEIWWRSNQNTNSVGNLVLHLCGNVRQWIISGLGRQSDTRRRAQEFSEEGPIAGVELMKMLDQTVSEGLLVLDRLDSHALLKTSRIQVYEEVSGLQAIFHVVEHFAYHTGQIIYITRLVKNTDLQFYQL